MDDTSDAVNEVRLVGRLGAAPEARTLPSGDSLLSFRLVVARGDTAKRSATRRGTRDVSIDTLDCVAWRAGVRRSVSTWAAGDTVEFSGSLRRRFWRGPSGAVSRTEVEVGKARRVRRAG